MTPNKSAMCGYCLPHYFQHCHHFLSCWLVQVDCGSKMSIFSCLRWWFSQRAINLLMTSDSVQLHIIMIIYIPHWYSKITLERASLKEAIIYPGFDFFDLAVSSIYHQNFSKSLYFFTWNTNLFHMTVNATLFSYCKGLTGYSCLWLYYTT